VTTISAGSGEASPGEDSEVCASQRPATIEQIKPAASGNPARKR
jgi:hypothetical protein